MINLTATGMGYSRRLTRGAMWFVGVNAVITITIMSYLLFSVFETADVVYFWVRVRFFALSLIPYLLLQFVFAYTENKHGASYVSVLIIIPIITNILVWFAPDLMWESWTYSRPHVINIEAVEYVGWFWIHSIYGLIGIVTSIVVILRYALQATHAAQRQAFLIVIAILIPAVVVLFPVLGLTRNVLNPFPISLAFTSVIVTYVLYREGLLNLSPLAYHTIIEEMRDAVFVLDAQNCLLLANQQAIQTFRVPNYPHVLNQRLIDIFPEEHAVINKYRDHWEGQFDNEFDIQGESYIFSIRLSPILNSHGQQEYKLLVMRDITKEKQNQRTHLQLELELERSEILKRFIQNTAHEFRTPLSVISTTSYLMTIDQTPEKRESRANIVTRQVDRITQLVDMMMKMSTLNSTSTVKRQQTNLNILIEDVKRSWASKTDIPIHTHFPDHDDIVIAVDALMIQESLFAVLENAVRFGDQDNRIDILTERTDHHIHIVIQDQGLGIHQDDLEHIFDTFWRKDVSHTSPGLGLGLPIAKRILTLHNGDIQVTSKPNIGTCVRLILPIKWQDHMLV